MTALEFVKDFIKKELNLSNERIDNDTVLEFLEDEEMH